MSMRRWAVTWQSLSLTGRRCDMSKRRYCWEVWVVYQHDGEPWFTGNTFADKGQAVAWAKMMTHIHRLMERKTHYELRRARPLAWDMVRSGAQWSSCRVNRVKRRLLCA